MPARTSQIRAAERTVAHKAIFNWIDDSYDTRRRHSTLDYLNPTMATDQR
jgi:hypothetical protein